MSAVAHPLAVAGPRDGGLAARRAVIRWAGRMFRREWRQQLLVVTLLTVAVAAAVGGITVVYNTSPADNAEHGSAKYLLQFDGTHPRKLEAELASARRWFGTIEVISHRSVPLPGSVETVDFRAEDPHGAYGSELLALRRGSYPTGPRQVAITDGLAKLLRLELGSTLALDGQQRTVVGIVENPRKLSDEFALVSPSSAGTPDHVTILVDTNDASIESFRQSLGERGQSSFTGSESRPNNRAADTLAMFSVATVFLLLASLVAAAGFAVVAQRRLRHLGMLAAVGATQKHLRLVLLTNGALVGTIAALAGTIVGLALWLAFAPTLESAVDHRIDRLSLPWELLAMVFLLAILGATAAAWWPARTVARLPVMLALSGRPPRPRPARHAAIAAAALIAVGIASLALSSRDRPPFIIVGIVATILGCLLLGPPAIRIFAGLARRLSIAPRLALRDLVRYQARSGAALAAVTLALGIAATVVVIASAEAAKRSAEPPNLFDGRRHRLGRGGEEIGGAAQPLQPTGPGLPGPTEDAGGHPRAGTEPDQPPVRQRPNPSRPARSCRRASAPQGLPTGHARLLRPVRRLPRTSDHRAHEEISAERDLVSPRSRALCRHAWDASLPRNRSRDDRSWHGLPRRSRRSHQRARRPELPGSKGVRGHQRPEDRHRPAPLRLRHGIVRAERRLHHSQRPSPPRLEGDSGRLAGRVEPAPDQRPDRTLPRARRRCRPHDRGAARKDLVREGHGHRDGRRRAPGARHPRDDRRTDPRREHQRPSHPDRNRSHLPHPPHADGRHRRRTRPPRRARRRGRRLRPPRCDVLRRPRLPKSRPAPLPRPRRRRRAAGRYRGRVAALRPRAARHRQGGDRMMRPWMVRIQGTLNSKASLRRLTPGGGADAPDYGGVRETSEYGANLPPVAHPRAHPGLPARGCVGAADARRRGRLPSARAPDRLGRPVARLAPLGAHALGDPVEGRRAARVGQPGCRLRGVDAPRPVAGGSARRPAGPRLRRAPLYLDLPARRRVGGGDRQPDHARRAACRLGAGRDGQLPRPAGRLREAQRTARNRLHGCDQAIPPRDRVPADVAADWSGVAVARAG